MQETKIQWTDFSCNPIKYRDAAGRVVWGCVKCSDGCKNCYAESTAWRWDRGGPFSLAVMKDLRTFVDEKELNVIRKSKKIEGKRVFIGDMTDIFGSWVPTELLHDLFDAMAHRPGVTFQILTKRPARMAHYLRGAWLIPLPNVWCGTSVEDQKAADARIPHLLECPAAVRFISAEPLLSAVNLNLIPPMHINTRGATSPMTKATGEAIAALAVAAFKMHGGKMLDWVIVGGESGPGARRCNVEWIRSVVAQCHAAGVACFVKQLGSKPAYYSCAAGEDCTHPDCGLEELKLKSSKGGNPEEWPKLIRVRQMPEARR